MDNWTQTSYVAYAPIYDASGQAQPGIQAAVAVLAWLAEHGAPVARALDLACGSGAAALTLASQGRIVVGLDRAPAMLALAEARARDARAHVRFVCADICAWNAEDWPDLLEDGFDLAVCFGAINELTEDRDLERLCSGVASALRPGGFWAFDIRDQAEYAAWDACDSVVYDGPGCLVYNRLITDPEQRWVTRQIGWFVREIDRWWRGGETHAERAWSPDEIAAALTQAGFTVVGRLGEDGRIWVAQQAPSRTSA